MRAYFSLFSSLLIDSAYLVFPNHSQRYTASLSLNYSASLSRDQLSQPNPILLSLSQALPAIQPFSPFLSLSLPFYAFLSQNKPNSAILSLDQHF